MKKLWTMLTILCLTAYMAGCGSDTGTKEKTSGKGKATNGESANGNSANGETTNGKLANSKSANGQTQTPKPKTPGADNTEKPADANSRQPVTTQPETNRSSDDRKPGANENTKFPEDDKDEEDQ